MALLQPPSYLQGVSTHTAQEDRLAIGGLFYRGGVGGLAAAAGLAVVRAQASPNMTLLVARERFTIPGTENTNQGTYQGYNDADFTVTVTASHPTLPRIDIVVANVRDAFYSGANNDWQIQVIAGTANASPVAPAPPVNAIVLANIAVAAAVTSITNANITIQPGGGRSAINGGIIAVQSQTERDALSPKYDGLYVDRADLNILERYNGASWDGIYPAIPPTWTNFTGFSAGASAGSPTPQWTKDPGTGLVHWRGQINATTTFAPSGVTLIASMPAAIVPASTRIFVPGVNFTSANHPVRINAVSDGSMQFWCSTSDSINFLALDGINYYTV